MEKDIVLAKYISGNCTTAEQALIEQWLDESPQHKEQYVQLLLLWKESEKLRPVIEIDENQAWERFQDRLMVLKNEKHSFSWTKIAAIFIMASSLAFLFFYKKSEHGVFTTDEISIATGNVARTEILPDGSAVILDAHSSIYYPAVFKEDIRSVELRGNAFFSIKANKAKPFVIHVNDIRINVLGTAFGVRSNNDTTMIDVSAGLVKLQRDADSTFLRAEESISIPTRDTVPMKNYIIKKIQSEILLKYLHNQKQDLIKKDLELSKKDSDKGDSTILNEKIKLFRAIYEKGGDTVLLKGSTLDSIVKQKMRIERNKPDF